MSLQQLKRKSLRDGWLMDGVVPSPGAEIDSPLFQTESKIQQLEKELESLQMQQLRLENPAAVQPEAKAIQTPFLNGEKIQQGGGQAGDAKEVTAGQANNTHGIIHEEQPTKEDQDMGTVLPIPAPRGKTVPKEDENQANPELKVDMEHQKVELVDLIQECPVENQTVEHVEKNKPHLDQEHTEKNQDGQHGILEFLTQDQQLGNPNLQHLDRYLITEVTVKHFEKNQAHPGQEKNQDEQHGILKYLTQDQQNENPNLGHLDQYLITEITLQSNPLENISVHDQTQSTSDQNMETKLPTDIPQQKESQSEGKIQTKDQGPEFELLYKDHSHEKGTTDQTQHQELLPSSIEPKEENPKAQDEKLDHHNESVSTVHEQKEVHDMDPRQLSTHQKSLSISEDQNQGSVSLSDPQNQDQSLALPEKGLEETPQLNLSHEVQCEEPSLMEQISISLLQSMEQNQEGADQTPKSVALEELSELLSSDMIKQSVLLSKNLEESPSTASTEETQETMCQAVIIPDLKKENSDPEVVQESSSHEPMSSTIAQSSSAEGNSSPESRPLLQKSQGTDSQQGGNTATQQEERRKKKTCQCCVVM
ncbi:paralemmin-3 [Xenopus laevis]|uniref:Paralemmin-3 n=1 Tax=Xenopus laevis TaxID=8355 RepID=PALM3_XENLA|nr:paralemmin-3 [Xenopus laevis]P20398.1 RecName: Full=Paralemmin-3; AltName: Full=Developmental protein XlGV7; AltName: Full=Xlcaax-1; Flags: Precursor [Xenopus laevis]CAA33637.1 xlgv7 gene product [Xenopus laevis]